MGTCPGRRPASPGQARPSGSPGPGHPPTSRRSRHCEWERPAEAAQRGFPFFGVDDAEVVAGIRIPDSKLAREATDLLREHGTPLLLAHSLRVYLFGAIRGRHRKLTVDHELPYFGAIFHDLGLTRSTAAPTTGSRSMERTRPGTSCGPTASTNRRPGWCGTRSRCTRRRRSRGTSGRRSRSSRAGSRRTSSATGWVRSRPATGTPCSPRTRGRLPPGDRPGVPRRLRSQARDRIGTMNADVLERTLPGYPGRLLRPDRRNPLAG